VEYVDAPAERWLTAEKLEAIFTVITFIAMFLGFFAERAEAGVVAFVAFTIAYITGGPFGLKAGVESLLHKTVDIDLLMILAAMQKGAMAAQFGKICHYSLMLLL